ncbi:putative subtilisin-like protease-like [Capsicum annuum]|uniref:Subtilisin-like protease SBT1.7 n=1 Tax=Capsicum annuum TaxID=4072 RepID=A0A2G3A7N7_CAPAN|nr:subtilisin-like protease 4 [Capsicum annuum]KAF3666029.1 putative subtilisin-like protease-like [Capsicum annuum]PHT90265.1 hypothetical protein T459_05378 [Capsicum annuum]
MNLKFVSTFFGIFILLHSSKTTFAEHFTNQNDLETYIVQLALPDDFVFSDSKDFYLWHQSFLPTNISDHSSRIIYSYSQVLNGFAAWLSPDEVKVMETKLGFVSARPQRVLQLHTTHSPSFLGLHQNVGLWKASNSGKGVIIGMLDSGITPQHPSFNDNGMPPPPAKWKGKCELHFKACNKKLIGARNFVKTAKSPLDGDGHGTHTSSTAAGNFVDGANWRGNANGTAAGIAPRAHLAIYKVCDDNSDCEEVYILAGYDAAIEDGVDVISISIGEEARLLYEEIIAIGAYSAIEKGIFVSCSAGNSGPFSATIENGSPWILTVGASTTDRKISAVAVLGNGAKYEGQSAFQSAKISRKLLPLINGGNCETLARIVVRGKIVLCETKGNLSETDKGQAVEKAGGAAMILRNEKDRGDTTYADLHVVPATHISYIDGLKIIKYINSTSAPVATISFKGTRFGDEHASEVAFFSSRGPNTISSGILKPDIIGPGVNILAGWIETAEGVMPSVKSFNMDSGTSMACPHLAGVAALLKSAHPDWSPAAIKSAIMTTADFVNLGNNPIQDEKLNPADLFTIGSGHVNPSKANDPGLIYDIQPQDYVPYLCGLNYTDQQVTTVVKRKVHCTSRIAEAELNYPSFSINLGSGAQTYTRTVTNVGEASSIYTVQVIGVEGVALSIKPRILKFSTLNQKLSYQVTFKRSTSTNSSQGYIKWSSAKYSVRSPISVFRSGK